LSPQNLLANMVYSNTTHKLYMFIVYFPLHVLVILLTIIRCNTGTEGNVLPKEASFVSLFLPYLYSTWWWTICL